MQPPGFPRESLDEREMAASSAPVYSYFMNYSGLDRCGQQGVVFASERANKQYHYDGESWREILRRYLRSPEAAEARKHLDALPALAAR